MESLSIWKSSWWLHYQAVSGEGGSSPGPGWCYPWDQDTEESPSVTTTLFALYLRILLYNKFDVAKPSDHITTIKLIPLSYSGGPTQCHDGQTISWPKLRRNLALPAFFHQYCWLQPMFLFSTGLIRVCWFLQRQGQWHSSLLNPSEHKTSGGICLSDFQRSSSKLYYSFNKKIDCCRLLWGVPLIRAQYIPIILLQ